MSPVRRSRICSPRGSSCRPARKELIANWPFVAINASHQWLVTHYVHLAPPGCAVGHGPVHAEGAHGERGLWQPRDASVTRYRLREPTLRDRSDMGIYSRHGL